MPEHPYLIAANIIAVCVLIYLAVSYLRRPKKSDDYIQKKYHTFTDFLTDKD